MSVTEIILLILGGLVFILSFLLPSRQKNREDDNQQAIREEQVKELLDQKVEEAKKQITDIVDETITYSMEKTERSMERLTNEKIMAVSEYSNTVLEQINKNHQETVFLYDMLNDKHESLKNSLSEASKTASEIKRTVKDAEITAKEAQAKAKEVQESLLQAEKKEKEAPAKRSVRQKAVSKQPEAEAAKAKKETPVSDVAEGVKEEKEAVDFVPIQPIKVELITPPEMAESQQPKTEKTDMNLAASDQSRAQNNNERILELHKAGKSNMAIARELGLGIGEVKLVIDLFEGI